MRRLSLVLLALTSLTLFGCDALRDAFSPRADVVARANDQTLTVDRLAGWAGESKQVPLDPLTLTRVSRYWVEYTLFAEALADGKTCAIRPRRPRRCGPSSPGSSGNGSTTGWSRDMT